MVKLAHIIDTNNVFSFNCAEHRLYVFGNFFVQLARSIGLPCMQRTVLSSYSSRDGSQFSRDSAALPCAILLN